MQIVQIALFIIYLHFLHFFASLKKCPKNFNNFFLMKYARKITLFWLEHEGQSIIKVKRLFQYDVDDIVPQLAIIKGNIQILVHTITALEEKLPINLAHRVCGKTARQLYSGALKSPGEKSRIFKNADKCKSTEGIWERLQWSTAFSLSLLL